jgi:DNA-binding transcriptional ArsR family regulator
VAQYTLHWLAGVTGIEKIFRKVLTALVVATILNQVVNNYPGRLDRVFGALADPTRRAILERLSRGESTVTELAAPFSSSLPAISKHLNVLEDAGLIIRQTTGRQRICTLMPNAMDDAARWIDHTRRFWTERLDALDEFLKNDTEEKK